MNPAINSLSSSARHRAIAIVSLIAGAGDLFSGILLVFAPLRALELMSAPRVQEPTLIQFVGVFVACVGASYILGLLSWLRTGSQARLRGIFEVTILFRLAAGSFVVWQIVMGEFTWAWASVPATDFTWALTQAILLRLGFFDSEI